MLMSSQMGLSGDLGKEIESKRNQIHFKLLQKIWGCLTKIKDG